MKQLGIDHFSGKRVWIIGASSGIGEACAKALIQKGAKVALSSRRVERLQEIANFAPAEQTLILPVDVTQDDQINTAHQKMVKKIGAKTDIND